MRGIDYRTVCILRIQVRASSQTKGLERGWKRRVRLGRDVFFLSPHTPYGRVRLARFARVRLLRHALPISLLILRKKNRLFCSLLMVWHDKSEMTGVSPSLTYMIGVTHLLTRQERGLLGWHNELSYSLSKQPRVGYSKSPRHRLLPASKNLVFKTEPSRLKFAS